MAEQYSRNNLRHVVAVICQSIGWRGIRSTPFEVLIDILERYLKNIGRLTHLFSEQFGRTVPNIDDVGLAFDVAGINLRELSEYIQAVGQVPCKHSVSQFPVPKPTSQQLPQHLSFFNNWAQIDKFDETEDGELDSLHLLPPTPLSDTDENKNFLKRNGDIGQTAVAVPPVTLEGIEELRPDDGVSTTACSVVAMAESGVLSSTRDGQQPLARKPPSPPHSAPTSSNNKKSVTGSKNEETKHKIRKKKKKSDKENNHTKPKKLKTLIGLHKHKAVTDKAVSAVKTEHTDHSNGFSKKIICKTSSMESVHEMKETKSSKSQVNNVPETSRLSSDLQSCSSKEGNVPIAVRINKSVVSSSVSSSSMNICIKNSSDFSVISETSIKKKDSGNSKAVNTKKESFKQSNNFVDSKEFLQDLFKPDIYKSSGGHAERNNPKLDSGHMNGHISPQITIPIDIEAKEIDDNAHSKQESIKDNMYKDTVNGKVFKKSEDNRLPEIKSVSLKTNHNISVKKENESAYVKKDKTKFHVKNESSAPNNDSSLVLNSRFRASLIYSSSDSEVDIESIDTRVEQLSPPHICKTPSPVGWADSPPPQRPRTPDITPSAIKHAKKKKKKKKRRKEEKESLPFDSEICHSPLPIRPPTPNIFLNDIYMSEEISTINKEAVVLGEELTKPKIPETVIQMTYQTPDRPSQSQGIIQTYESKKHKSKKKKKHKDSSPSKHKLKKKKEQKSSDLHGSTPDKLLKITTDFKSDHLRIVNAVKHKWEEKFQATKKEESTQESSKSSLVVTTSLKLTVPIPPIKKLSPTLPISRLPVVPQASPSVPVRTPITGSRKRKASTPSSQSSKKKKKMALNEQHNSNNVTPQTVVEKNLDSKKLTAPVTEDEPIGFYFDESGNRVWVCPTCKGQDDGRPMIRCDDCYAWYHWACVGITTAPDENIDWFCSYCFKKKDGVRHRKKKSKKPKD